MAEKSTVAAEPTLAADPEPSASKVDETLAVPNAQEGTTLAESSSCDDNNNNHKVVETSDPVVVADREKSLDYAAELVEKGSKAVKDSDFSEAAECFSRALEIRAAHYGELALECVNLYYEYGSALLRKAQDEADPLGMLPKKDGELQHDSRKDGSFNGSPLCKAQEEADALGKVPEKDSESQRDSYKDGSVNNTGKCESSTVSASSSAQQAGNSDQKEGTGDDGSSGKEDEDDEKGDVEDLAEAEEDESDLDLAWKMLDVARAIIEKHCGDTMEKVDILSALAEVALEREDIETSLGDYKKALFILERLVEPDSRLIAELNFRICLCLEIGSMAQEAIPYCEKAISTCKSRVQRLMDEVKSSSESATTSDGSGSSQVVLSSASQSVVSLADKEAEIETLNGLSSELEKKLEDLRLSASNPSSILSEILGIAKAKGSEKNLPSAMSSSQMAASHNNGSLDSPTVSSAPTNGAAGVTHLGVVGRGVKRVLTNTSTEDPGQLAKKPALSSSEDKDKGDAS